MAGRVLAPDTLLHRSDMAQRPRPGVVLLDERLDVIASTAEADDLLSLTGDDGSAGLPLPLPVYGVAALLANPAHNTLRVPSVRVPTRRGRWLDLHASWLPGPPSQRRIAVVVEPVEPHACLRATGRSVYAINPKAVDRYRDRHGVTGKKSDLLTELAGRCAGRDVRARAGLARFPRRDQRRGPAAGAVRAGGAAVRVA